MYRKVHALTGPQLAAVLRHLQHPDWPIDRASDVTPADCWLPSHDEVAFTEVTAEYPDPLDPDWLLPETSWVHRTAQIPVDALEVREVDGLWLAPLLTGLAEPIVRTLAVHIHFTPAREAKAVARRDVTTDQRDILARERKGQMVDDDTELALSSSARRMSDLREGIGHHGAHWAAFLTVSARTRSELSAACAHLEAAAADDAGINRLDWLDTLQSAAQATTWPLGRGMTTPPRPVLTRAMRKVGTATAKETDHRMTTTQPATEPEPPRVRSTVRRATADGGGGGAGDRVPTAPRPEDAHRPVRRAGPVEGPPGGRTDHHPAGGGVEHRDHRLPRRRTRGGDRHRPPVRGDDRARPVHRLRDRHHHLPERVHPGHDRRPGNPR